MRDLNTEELKQVVGGTYDCCECECECPPPKNEKQKNNNGFGNGPESGPAPGNSGKTGVDKAENIGR